MSYEQCVKTCQPGFCKLIGEIALNTDAIEAVQKKGDFDSDAAKRAEAVHRKLLRTCREYASQYSHATFDDIVSTGI